MVKLLIGTPAYNSLVHTDYLHSIISYTQIKDVQFSVLTLGNESLITRARNKIFSVFVKSEFDYLLFLDADIMFPATELIKLFSHNKDLIGAPVRLKDPNRVVFNFGKILDDSQKPLLEVDRIGNAIMLISKKLALDVVNYCEESGDYYYNNPNYSRGDEVLSDKDKVYDVFKVGVKNNEYLSEDYWFCALARELGHKIFIDVSCQTIHNGVVSLPTIKEA